MEPIAFDIDDVLAQFMPGLLRFLELTEGKVFNEKEMHYREHYGDVWGVSKDDAIRIVGNYYSSEEFENMQPVPGALETLHRLKAAKRQIFAITSRPEAISDRTLTWLKQNFGDIFTLENTFFTGRFHGGKKSKGQVCAELGIDCLVEDDIFHAQSCIEHGVEVLLINKPWNEDTEFEHELIYRIDTISQVADFKAYDLGGLA